uniref:Uncharacterized protein n=1 Tax=Myripristis murdjan TaxID=586833 RepID=A0A667XSH1_9TELE
MYSVRPKDCTRNNRCKRRIYGAYFKGLLVGGTLHKAKSLPCILKAFFALFSQW